MAISHEGFSGLRKFWLSAKWEVQCFKTLTPHSLNVVFKTKTSATNNM